MVEIESLERYEKRISVEYKIDAPFDRTVIIEEDSVLGRRETCLYGTRFEINSEVCLSK